MGSYLEFCESTYILKEKVKVIFELGSRDLNDALKLFKYFNSKVYAFECNPDCLELCKKKLNEANIEEKKNIILVENAVSLTDEDVKFYPFDLIKYNNMGASSMFKIDFSLRDINDTDYNRENPQKEIIVKGKRLDTFMDENNLQNVDMLCIDLQGYELNALKSLGEKIKNVKYIITECSVKSTYIGGATFTELNDYLSNYNFKYVFSNKYSNNFPPIDISGFSEFDALFINNDF